MPRHTKKTNTSDTKPGSGAKKRNSPQQQAEQREAENDRRFIDRSTEGMGLAVQDLPGAEHGQNVVDPPEEMTRLNPSQHGGEMAGNDNYNEGGLRGDRNMSDADGHGGRKHN